MRRTHPPPDAPARAPVATVPNPLQPLWALAVAIAESAAEIATASALGSWRASAYLYAAADQAWGADGGGGAGGWRAERGGPGGEFRFAVLLAEAATARFIAATATSATASSPPTSAPAPPGWPPAPSSSEAPDLTWAPVSAAGALGPGGSRR